MNCETALDIITIGRKRQGGVGAYCTACRTRERIIPTQFAPLLRRGNRLRLGEEDVEKHGFC